MDVIERVQFIFFLLLLIPAGTCALSTVTRPTEWQDDLMRAAQPLKPTPMKHALETLTRDGVVRLEDVRVDPQYCQRLRDRILKEALSPPQTTTTTTKDNQYIPGTRIRFREYLDLTFAGDARHDLLLPLETCLELTPVLHSAVSQLEPLLPTAAHQLLPRLHGSTRKDDNDVDNGIELVELASLLVRPGSTHQACHGDFQRFRGAPIDPHQPEPAHHTAQRIGKLPPRLVCFVALQDIPTNQHGATAFITGTHNAQAHELIRNNNEKNDDSSKENQTKTTTRTMQQNQRDLMELTTTGGVCTTAGFSRGDMLVYDASVLHWGSTNSVPQNDRVMLYFGVAYPGTAALLDATTTTTSSAMEDFEAVAPITLCELIARGNVPNADQSR